uniref:Tripartite motif containing 69 n=1 Tax=Amphilophus citrinellus TaxID=61819 RepID=A0A3Q0RCC5_AMPCI
AKTAPAQQRMAEASALEELQSELTCPVCLELFRGPVILECGHHFCQVCIIQCWEAKSDEFSNCPKCRKSCARKLRPNSLLCNIVESVRRTISFPSALCAGCPGTTRPTMSSLLRRPLKTTRYCFLGWFLNTSFFLFKVPSTKSTKTLNQLPCKHVFSCIGLSLTVFDVLPAVTCVTLDPDTAYPCLWVSPCRTSVKVGKLQANLPNNPERFTLYNIVLGSEAFTSGRHYWEVEVGSKTAWGLGVATASVNRKEEISLCPDDGFWTLVLRDDGNGTSEYEACTDSDENLLYPSKPPKRVGIYLDYGRGQVTFYDAADMSHLFTFNDAKFKEPVFPYFNPWPIINGHNREPLTIVTPQWG